jgi:gamma-glutamylcyclotransferase (GGCT)/AIG2-like uncharacterized protein YtfP
MFVMLYFAYGSNMNWEQIRCRCPSARFVCTARLRDHRLVFSRKSEKRGGGVASIEPRKDCVVWGVVFQIDELELGKLDRFEGYNPDHEPKQNSYLRKEIHVAADGDECKPVSALTYVANPQPGQHKPNKNYKQIILEGARFWHLPSDYVRKLEAIEISD